MRRPILFSSPPPPLHWSNSARTVRPFSSRFMNRVTSAISRTLFPSNILDKQEVITAGRHRVKKNSSSDETLPQRLARSQQGIGGEPILQDGALAPPPQHQTVFPRAINVTRGGTMLELHWSDDDGGTSVTPRNETEQCRRPPLNTSTRLLAELLRVYNPSTDVLGAGVLIYGKRGVKITQVIPMGNYSVRLVFSDGHNGGIFPYGYLREMGDKKWSVMRQYILRLKAAARAREVIRRNRSTRSPSNQLKAEKPCHLKT